MELRSDRRRGVGVNRQGNHGATGRSDRADEEAPGKLVFFSKRKIRRWDLRASSSKFARTPDARLACRNVDRHAVGVSHLKLSVLTLRQETQSDLAFGSTRLGERAGFLCTKASRSFLNEFKSSTLKPR